MKQPADAPDAWLRAARLRRTPVRMGVLQVLARTDRSLDVPQILRKLPAGADAVTVYRTLNTFSKKKLVHRVRGEDRAWRYALNNVGPQPRHPHPHFVCDQCGSVDCLHEAKVPAHLTAELNVGPEYQLSYAEIILHGTCGKCRPR